MLKPGTRVRPVKDRGNGDKKDTSRQPDSDTSDVRHSQVDCPQCGDKVNVLVAEVESRTDRTFCGHCFTTLTISDPQRIISLGGFLPHEPLEPEEHNDPDGESGND